MGTFEKAIRLCIWVSGLFFISAFCKKQTQGFSIGAISSSHPYIKEYDTRPLLISEEKELKHALEQPYNYFGRGGQAFVFFSEDGKYVVKFFKQRLFRKNWLLNHIPLPKVLHRYRAKRNWKREDKHMRDFFSYKIAFEEFLDETGLLFVHLNPTNTLQTKLTIEDPLHLKHTIDLDKFDFIVQRRAENTLERIDQYMRNGDIEKAEDAIKKMLLLISLRCKKGFIDRDPNIGTNCGFIGDRAIKIDVGRLAHSEEMKQPEKHNLEILHVTKSFEKWIEAFYPELLPSLKTHIKETLL